MVSDKDAVVAILESHRRADDTICQIQKCGFDMTQLSIIGMDHHPDENEMGWYSTGERMKHRGKPGVLWGGFWGMLFGSAFICLPGIGLAFVAGPIAVWIVSALESAAVLGGRGALGAALLSVGVPKNNIPQFVTEVINGKLLLVAQGTSKEVQRAKDVLDQTKGIQRVCPVNPVPAAGGRTAPRE
jgi:hypothetical protein